MLPAQGILRRSFLKAPAIATAAVAIPAAETLPTVPLGKFRVTRLIVGHNPMYGFSHFNALFNQTMEEWFTPDRVSAVLRQCEQNGINTWLIACRPRCMSDLKKYRDEGGKIQTIILSQPDIEKDPKLISGVAAVKPVGIVHHGASTDRKFREGNLSLVHDFVQSVRDYGVLAGVSTHNPMVIETLEEKGWGADFYMGCFYQLTRTQEEIEKLLGQRPLGEVFLPTDPVRMCRTLRQVKKTCLGFKLLGAGRVTDKPAQIDKAFEFAFTNLKAQDAVIVGMYPRYTDQVKEDADRVRRIARA